MNAKDFPTREETRMDPNGLSVGSYPGDGASPRSASKSGLRRSLIIIIVMTAVLLGSMLVLPVAILYFIDPSIADFFLTYSAPYIGLTVVIVLAILTVTMIVGAAVRKRNTAQAYLSQSPQYRVASTTEPLEQQDQPAQIREREIVHEIVRIRCQYCGTLNLETATKCESCGANL